VCVTYVCKFMGPGKARLIDPSCTDSKSKPSTLQYMTTYWCLLQVTYMYEVQYKSNASYFFLRNYNYSYNATCTHDAYIFCNVVIILHKVSLFTKTLSLPLPKMLYAGHVKLFASHLSFHIRCVSVHLRLYNSALWLNLSGGQRNSSCTVLN
jgi:hypothetical protein